MTIEFKHFPIVSIVEALVDFTRYQFKTPGITPSDWRWDSDPKRSMITIRGDYSLEEIRPDSQPVIAIVRNSFGFSNSSLDNLEKADANTFSNAQKRDWLIGSIDIICASRSKNEADCLASFLALVMQSERHMLRSQLPFLKSLSYAMIGPPTPGAVTDVEIRRWMTTLRLNVELNMAWVTRQSDEVKWEKLNIYTTQNGSAYESDVGTMAEHSSVLVDLTADFGLEVGRAQKFNSAELAQGWYYVFLGTDKTRYTIREIVSPTELRLVYQDGGVDHGLMHEAFAGKYKIVWNNVHFAASVVAKN
jgi:hypothetical protein